MAQIVRTATSKRDVSSIAAYISADSARAADRWLDSLDETLTLLAQNPLIGERVDYLAPGLRRHCHGSYLIFYRPLSDGIELRRVLHGARNIDELF